MPENPYTINTPSAGKQFLVAVFFGAIAATIAYVICDRITAPDQQPEFFHTQGAYKFMFYVSALAGGLVFIVAGKLYKLRADKQYKASLGPPTATALARKG